MNQDHIDSLRNPRFTLARRGYDMREVDTFMLRMADWLESDAVAEIGSYAVQRKLELVGKTTTQILKTTEEESERLRRDADDAAANLRDEARSAAGATRLKADDYSKDTRAKADAYVAEVRRKADAYAADAHKQADAYAADAHSKADAYATRTRAVADEEGRGLVAAATAKANQIVAKGEQRRSAIETVIKDLQARRDEVLDELDRLGAAVAKAVTTHRPPAAAKAPSGGSTKRPAASPRV